MGIRQTLNRNPVITSAIAAVIITIVAATQLKRACSGPSSDESQGTPRRAYFTIDDGKNWFPDDGSKVPPFKHQGKDAYRVAVFRCAAGKPFVARLERFSEPTRKRLQDAVDAARDTDKPVPAGAPHVDMEVKRPGDKEWVRQSPKTAKEYAAVMEVRCPDGSSEGIEPVYPD